MTGTIATASHYVGRFAPSPTGRLHLGSLVGAIISYIDARAHNGQWLVRVEDIDPPREVAGASDAILAALTAHGFEHDGDVRYQSDSNTLHNAAIERLVRDGHAYYCDCARKKLIAAGHGRRYPGFCRDKQLTSGAMRVRVSDTLIDVNDRWQQSRPENLEQTSGDFIVRRRDGLVAYQLAVVVDDADQGITDVVRGVDLYDSTARQIWLQRLLGLETPRYAHFPVLVDGNGDKLSKQTGADELDIGHAARNMWSALSAIGLTPPTEIGTESATSMLNRAVEQLASLDLAGKQSLVISV